MVSTISVPVCTNTPLSHYDLRELNRCRSTCIHSNVHVYRSKNLLILENRFVRYRVLSLQYLPTISEHSLCEQARAQVSNVQIPSAVPRQLPLVVS